MDLIRQLSTKLGSPKSKQAPNQFEQPEIINEDIDEPKIGKRIRLLSLGVSDARAVQPSTVAVSRRRVSASDVDSLENQLRKAGNPDPNVALKLGIVYIEKYYENMTWNKGCLLPGILLVEWSRNKGLELTPQELKLLANAHFTVFIFGGCSVDNFHVNRALELYETLVALADFSGNASVWLEYCQLLQVVGDMEKAEAIMKTILTNFEDDPNLPVYLFTAGALSKSQGLYDKASSYFFEAAQIGPPKFFSKLEMMCIISRNIEESGKSSEDSSDDAYKMVFTHLVIDGHISEDVEYDDWISNANTWRILADKCSVYRLYSLAADLYGQAIMKDSIAFRKSKLWFAFAKACYRCGRISDAQLGIKQAMTTDPFNPQLLKMLTVWTATEQSHIAALIAADNVTKIIEVLPTITTSKSKGIQRFQATIRGFIDRKCISLGAGKSGTLSKVGAKIGIIMEGIHPVIVSTRSDWMGRLQKVRLFDVNDGRSVILKLKTIFAPPKQLGSVRQFKLLLLFRPESSILQLRFQDQQTKEYLSRELRLPGFDKLFPAPVEFEASTVTATDTTSKTHNDNNLVEAEESTTFSRAVDFFSEVKEVDEPGEEGEGDGIDLQSSVITDIVDLEIARGSIQRGMAMFFYRVFHEESSTIYVLHVVKSAATISFVTTREYIDRSVYVKVSLHKLLDIIDSNPALSSLVTSLMGGILPADVASQADDIPAGGFLVNYTIDISDNRLQFNVRKRRGGSVISQSMEILDSSALAHPSPPSRAKKRAREASFSDAVSRVSQTDLPTPSASVFLNEIGGEFVSISFEDSLDTFTSDPSFPAAVAADDKKEQPRISPQPLLEQDAVESVVTPISEVKVKMKKSSPVPAPQPQQKIDKSTKKSGKKSKTTVSAQSKDIVATVKMDDTLDSQSEADDSYLTLPEVSWLECPAEPLVESFAIFELPAVSIGEDKDSLARSDSVYSAGSNSRDVLPLRDIEEVFDLSIESYQDKDALVVPSSREGKLLAEALVDAVSIEVVSTLVRRSTPAGIDGDQQPRQPAVLEANALAATSSSSLPYEMETISHATEATAQGDGYFEELGGEELDPEQLAMQKRFAEELSLKAALEAAEEEFRAKEAAELKARRAADDARAREETKKRWQQEAIEAKKLQADREEAELRAKIAESEKQAREMADFRAKRDAERNRSAYESMGDDGDADEDLDLEGRSISSILSEVFDGPEALDGTVDAAGGPISLLFYDDLYSDYQLKQLGLQELVIGSPPPRRKGLGKISRAENSPRKSKMVGHNGSIVSSVSSSAHKPSSPVSLPPITPESLAKRQSKARVNERLYRSSKQRVRKPVKLTEIPRSAFDSPENLKLALRRMDEDPFGEVSLSDEGGVNPIADDNEADAFTYDYNIIESFQTSPIAKKKQQPNKSAVSRSQAASATSPVHTAGPATITGPKTNTTIEFLDKVSGRSIDSSHFHPNHSIAEVKLRGYVNGDCTYTAHWEKKIVAFLKKYPSATSLRKALSSLQRNLPITISRVEALCALADTSGNDVEAIGKIADVEFVREIKLVCGVLRIESLVALIPGGSGVLNSDDGDVLSPSKAGGGANGSPAKKSGEATALARAMRVHGVEASQMLPHLNMSSLSPIVKRRSSVVEDKNLMLSRSQTSLPPLQNEEAKNFSFKKTHLKQAVDEFFARSSDRRLFVMCRRDALRALGEELIVKSHAKKTLTLKGDMRNHLLNQSI